MTHSLKIGAHHVGPGNPCFVIAEISANHNGSFERAADLIRAAKEYGADAVKLQTYTADTMTIDCDAGNFVIKGGSLWDGRTLYDLYLEATTPWEWQPELKKLAEELDLVFFSTAFDPTAVEFLEKIDVPAYKIASLELVDDGLLRQIGMTGKPVFLATGLATAEEIDHALGVLDASGAGGVALLHCVSDYPAKIEEMNIRTVPDMARRFGRVAGLSDHSMTHIAALGAVALGANVIEKHFTMRRSEGGLDAAFSLEPEELRVLVGMIRDLEASLGAPQYEPTTGETASLLLRRSLFVVADIAKGEKLTEQNIRAIRPGQGLAPRHYPEILGRKAIRDIKRGEPVGWDLLQPDSH